MTNLYCKIVDFVSLAKKLEFKVREKYNYSGESIFRGRIEKVIPIKGEIDFDGNKFDFYFHGLGIDFKSVEKIIHYQHYSGSDGLGVYFTLEGLFENHNYKPSSNIQEEFNSLIQMNLIRQWMPDIPGSSVFFLV